MWCRDLEGTDGHACIGVLMLAFVLRSLWRQKQALEVIGNNNANAATEGYHRQRVEIRPRDEVYSNGHLIGQGVEVVEVTRLINQFIDDEIVNQESTICRKLSLKRTQ